jgi:hypothetical protein
MKRRTLLLALACSACATTPSVPEPEFKPTGGVVTYGKTASFDATRVRSVSCNLRMREDGSWGGSLGDRGIDVSVNDVTVKGVDLLISREDSRPGKTIITAQFKGLIYRFEFQGERAVVRTPSASLSFGGRVLGDNVAHYGPMGEFELRGEASKENPPWPQFAFALLAAYVGEGQ